VNTSDYDNWKYIHALIIILHNIHHNKETNYCQEKAKRITKTNGKK
jgi:hypothetical protein